MSLIAITAAFLHVVAAPISVPVQPPIRVPVISTGPVPEGRWERIGEQHGITVFLDADSIRPVGGRLLVRARAVGVMLPRGAISALLILELDCVTRTGAPVESRYFDRDGLLLEVRQVPAEGRRFAPAAIGSVDELLQARVCGSSTA